MNQNQKTKVVIRVRPLLTAEQQKGLTTQRMQVDAARKVIKLYPHLESKSSLASQNAKSTKLFSFDIVYNAQTSQQALYSDLQIEDLVDKVVEGYNATIFVYGQTGSGKTYTIEGLGFTLAEYHGVTNNIQTDLDAGIVTRAIKQLFRTTSLRPLQEQVQISFSMFQVYNEKIYDLLNFSVSGGDAQSRMQNQEPLKVSEKTDGFQISNLFQFPCPKDQDALDLLEKGVRNRIVASHSLNHTSSRSHVIFQIQVDKKTLDGFTQSSRLLLVDLAGSERISYTAQPSKTMQQETIGINKSLMTLRKVISALAHSVQSRPHVPFRESKLTQILKQSFGGSSYCLMIACLSPCDRDFEENLSTLTYAKLTTDVTINPTLQEARHQQLNSIEEKGHLSENELLRLQNLQLNAEIERLTKLINKQPDQVPKPEAQSKGNSNKRYNSGSSDDFKSANLPQSTSQQTNQFERIIVGLKETLTEGKPLPSDTKKILKRIIHDGHNFETLSSQQPAYSDYPVNKLRLPKSEINDYLTHSEYKGSPSQERSRSNFSKLDEKRAGLPRVIPLSVKKSSFESKRSSQPTQSVPNLIPLNVDSTRNQSNDFYQPISRLQSERSQVQSGKDISGPASQNPLLREKGLTSRSIPKVSETSEFYSSKTSLASELRLPSIKSYQQNLEVMTPIDLNLASRKIPSLSSRSFLDKNVNGNQPALVPKQIEQVADEIDDKLNQKIVENRSRIFLLQKMINPYSNAPVKYPLKPKSTLSHIEQNEEEDEFQDEADYTTNYETAVDLGKDGRSLFHRHLARSKGAVFVNQLPSGIASAIFKPKESALPTMKQMKLSQALDIKTQANTYEEWAKLYGKNGLYEQPVSNNR